MARPVPYFSCSSSASFHPRSKHSIDSLSSSDESTGLLPGQMQAELLLMSVALWKAQPGPHFTIKCMGIRGLEWRPLPFCPVSTFSPTPTCDTAPFQSLQTEHSAVELYEEMP